MALKEKTDALTKRGVMHPAGDRTVSAHRVGITIQDDGYTNTNTERHTKKSCRQPIPPKQQMVMNLRHAGETSTNVLVLKAEGNHF